MLPIYAKNAATPRAGALAQPTSGRRLVCVRVAEPVKRDLLETLTAKVLEYADKYAEAERRISEAERSAKEDVKKYADKCAEYLNKCTDLELRAERRRYLLLTSQGKLMRMHGMLSMRGVYDFIYKLWDDEEDLQRGTFSYRKDRLKQWTKFLKNNDDLLQCVQQHAKTRFNDAYQAAQYLVAMYKKLSNEIHNDRSPAEYTQAGDEVQIMDGVLDRRQCRVLKCVCDDFDVPVRIVFKAAPASIDDSDDESSD